jgi:hypothetical protein
MKEDSLKINILVTLDLLVGETLVRKLIVTLSLDFADSMLSASLVALESHDQYLRPLSRESFANQAHHLLTVPFSLSSIVVPACYGLSAPEITKSENNVKLEFQKSDKGCT